LILEICKTSSIRVLSDCVDKLCRQAVPHSCAPKLRPIAGAVRLESRLDSTVGLAFYALCGFKRWVVRVGEPGLCPTLARMVSSGHEAALPRCDVHILKHDH
jgi:hypothetical protein